MDDSDERREEVKRWRWTQAEKAKNLDRAWEQMMAQIREVGLPEHYTDDVYFWDRVVLREHLPDEFGWILRVCGSWLFRPPASPNFFTGAVVANLKPPNHERPRFYWWNGRDLAKIDWTEFCNRLFALYYKRFRDVLSKALERGRFQFYAEKEAQILADRAVSEAWEGE